MKTPLATKLKAGAEKLAAIHKALAARKQARNGLAMGTALAIALVVAGIALEDKGNNMKYSVLRQPTTVPIMEGETQKGEITLPEGMEVEILNIEIPGDQVFIRSANNQFQGWVDKTAITGPIETGFNGPTAMEMRYKMNWPDPTILHLPLLRLDDHADGFPYWIPPVPDEKTEAAFAKAQLEPWEGGEFNGSALGLVVLLKQGETQSYVRKVDGSRDSSGSLVYSRTVWEGWVPNEALGIYNDLKAPEYNGPIPDPGADPVPPPQGWKIRALAQREGMEKTKKGWIGQRLPDRDYWATGESIWEIWTKEAVAALLERKGASLSVSRKGGEQAGKKVKAPRTLPPSDTVQEIFLSFEEYVTPAIESMGIARGGMTFSDISDWERQGVNVLKIGLPDFTQEVSGLVKQDTTAIAVLAKANWAKEFQNFKEDKEPTNKREYVLLSSYNGLSDRFMCRRIDKTTGRLEKGYISAQEVQNRGVCYIIPYLTMD